MRWSERLGAVYGTAAVARCTQHCRYRPAAGELDAAGLLRLLGRLGLEPSEASVAALMAELAVPRTGVLGVRAPDWGGRGGGSWQEGSAVAGLLVQLLQAII